ncbi:hypothetical protein [Geitlerinema sp. PCC 9228]|uniref:hypothetical protein n=1 Tax=Geitlerinema sp. PCC 9228 TaxID=111611 RepID=UPI001114CEAF|nr:hypothetical protein [Geitlerinema sp. PCC 9228]
MFAGQAATPIVTGDFLDEREGVAIGSVSDKGKIRLREALFIKKGEAMTGRKQSQSWQVATVSVGIAGWLAVGNISIPVVRSQTEREVSPPAETVSPTQTNTIRGQLDSNSDILEDGSYYQTHTFTGEAGEEIAIEVVSADFDAYLILLDAEGRQMAENDDGGGGGGVGGGGESGFGIIF